MDKEHINYSQCWEDPLILLEALSIRAGDAVLSITSGGDNTLALLLSGASKIVSIDLNAAQNHLLELKWAAIATLSYDEYLEFLGVRPSSHRLKLFKNLHSRLPSDTLTWWQRHENSIQSGVLKCGRFEQFTVSFARYVLPLIHSKKTIVQLLNCHNLEEQRDFYKNHWDSKRWRFFFGLASNRLMLKRFARQRGMSDHAQGGAAEVYRKRLERHLTSVPISGNFFLQYSLTGAYIDALPPYLEASGYDKLRATPHNTLSIETRSLIDYLRETPENTFAAFNLSDIFEALTQEENNLLWHEIIRTAAPGARVAYWNNLAPRTYPAAASAHIQTNGEMLRGLRARDRVFFYDTFYAHTILK